MKRLTQFSLTLVLSFIFVKSFAQLDTTAFLTKWYRCIKLSEDLPSLLIAHFEVESVEGRLVGYFPIEMEQNIKDNFQSGIDCYNEKAPSTLIEKIILVHHFKFYKSESETDLTSADVRENLYKYKTQNHLHEKNSLDIIAMAGPVIHCGQAAQVNSKTVKPPPQLKSLKSKF